jgi:hypothetical protein
MTKKLIMLVILLYCSIPAFGQGIAMLSPDSIPFAPAVNYGAGDGSNWLFCADLDGDSYPDFTVVNRTSNNVSILKNNGDGTFQNKVDYDVGDYPVSVFCADLDGDGDLDLAVANRNSDNVSILKNNGDATFQPKVDYEAGGGPHSVFCADLDGDLDLDLAVVNVWDDDVSIFKNNGDGTFETKVDYGVGDYPLSVFCADLDGDLDFDLAVANAGEYGSSVSILKNNGDGTFQTKVDYVVGAYPRTIFCADLDGDSDFDLAVGNAESDDVSILKNNGDGTFQAKVDYGVGDYPHSVFCADLDGDSRPDLAVANLYSDNISILKNNGDGTFQTKVDYITGDGASSIFCADLDGDGDLDLSVANQFSNNVSVLKNLTPTNPLVGYWKFEEDTGTTAHDSSGKNNHGIIYGTTWTDGKLGKGLNFTKLSDYVEVNDSPSLDLTDHLTITAWIKPHDYPDHTPKIVGKGYANTYSYWLGFAGVSVILTLENSAGYCEAYHSFLLDEWAYVAATWDGTTMRIYINGKDEGSTVRNYTGTLTPNEHPLIIGSRDNAYNDYFNGTIDEVKIYNTALSEDEIKEEYERATLAACWKFDEGTGSIAYDSSAFGNNGTLMNGPTWVDGLPLLGKALEFDTDYVRVPSSPILEFSNPITVMAWAKSEASTGDYQIICGKWFDDDGEFIGSFDLEFAPDGITPSFTVVRTGDQYRPQDFSSIEVPSGQWAHIAGTYDNDTNRIYVNGVLAGSISLPGTMNTGTQPVAIGAHVVPYERNWFNGIIDEVKIYSRVLSAEEIKAEFEAGFIRGDANADGTVSLVDVIYLANYVLKGGSMPNPLQSGDVNCDGFYNLADVIKLARYVLFGESFPC